MVTKDRTSLEERTRWQGAERSLNIRGGVARIPLRRPTWRPVGVHKVVEELGEIRRRPGWIRQKPIGG